MPTTTKIQHTPGPWRLGDSYKTRDIKAGHNALVCRVELTHDQGEANANLIAAAPDLLEALEYLVSADDDICNNRGLKSDQAMNRIAALDMACAAIARAKEEIK